MMTSKDVPVPKDYRDGMLTLPSVAGSTSGKMAPGDFAKGKIEAVAVCEKCLRSVPRTMVVGDMCMLCRAEENR